MEEKKFDSENVFSPSQGAVLRSAGDYYESASSIADDLNSSLLAELDLSDATGAWEKGLSLLSEYSWIADCGPIVEKLIQLREISPLDIVAVSAITERVSLRPFLCSLALALRKLLQRVVLIDCDLREPSLHTVVAGEGREGFIDMVKYGCSFSTVASETEKQGIYIIGAGSHPVSSEGELVGRELERVFHSLRTKADITLACVPPFLLRRQMNPVLNCVDGVILCLNNSAGTKNTMRGDFSTLWRSDVPILGIVAQKQPRVEERQTVVLRAHNDDAQAPAQQISAGKAQEAGSAARGLSHPNGAAGAGADEIADSSSAGAREKQPRAWEPISSEREETAGLSSLSRGVGSPDGIPRRESELVEKALFGRQRQWGQYAIGICVVLAIVGVLALKQAKFTGSGALRMDERMMRSILLPGSDGVMAVDENKRPQAAVTPGAPGAAGSLDYGRSAGTCVLVSARTNRDDAARDSASVAGIGYRVVIEPAGSGEEGRRYRVIAGPFHTVDEAKVVVSRIVPLGLSTETRIITEGVKE